MQNVDKYKKLDEISDEDFFVQINSIFVSGKNWESIDYSQYGGSLFLRKKNGTCIPRSTASCYLRLFT